MALSKEKARKVYQLYLRGSPNESAAAEKILKDSGIDPSKWSELTEDQFKKARIPFRSRLERQIVLQVLAKVLNKGEIAAIFNRTAVECLVPARLHAQAVENARSVLNLWRKELERFTTAFIVKNRLWAEDKSTGRDIELSEDEIMDIMKMANSIKQVHLGNLFEKW